ncbi:hypothetical protein V1477_005963 [Vespula maculifrons]|uniref:Uncharacterized protein n=1 Tax=Vespula maculifrons TaxID=7453 RepID=A0ABD2CL31_VESMC
MDYTPAAMSAEKNSNLLSHFFENRVLGVGFWVGLDWIGLDWVRFGSVRLGWIGWWAGGCKRGDPLTSQLTHITIETRPCKMSIRENNIHRQSIRNGAFVKCYERNLETTAHDTVVTKPNSDIFNHEMCLIEYLILLHNPDEVSRLVVVTRVGHYANKPRELKNALKDINVGVASLSISSLSIDHFSVPNVIKKYWKILRELFACNPWTLKRDVSKRSSRYESDIAKPLEPPGSDNRHSKEFLTLRRFEVTCLPSYVIRAHDDGPEPRNLAQLFRPTRCVTQTTSRLEKERDDRKIEGCLLRGVVSTR